MDRKTNAVIRDRLYSDYNDETGVETWLVGSNYVDQVTDRFLQQTLSEPDILTPFAIPTSGFAILWNMAYVNFNFLLLDKTALETNTFAQVGLVHLDSLHYSYLHHSGVGLKYSAIPILASPEFQFYWNQYVQDVFRHYAQINQRLNMLSPQRVDEIVQDPNLKYLKMMRPAYVPDKDKFLYYAYVADIKAMDDNLRMGAEMYSGSMIETIAQIMSLMAASMTRVASTMMGLSQAATFLELRVAHAVFGGVADNWILVKEVLSQKPRYQSATFFSGMDALSWAFNVEANRALESSRHARY